jgi:beta-phosphoglucomutase-like phosphatase (HAD superfamily)
MDGVIIDSEPIHFRMIKNYLNELGITITDEECEIFAGLANKEIFASMKANHGLRPTAEELTTIYESRYLEYLKSMSDEKPIAFVDELIIDINNRGIPIALASSASNENISTVLRKFRLDKYFGITISGCDLKKSKPSPDIYFRAAELLGFKYSKYLLS